MLADPRVTINIDVRVDQHELDLEDGCPRPPEWLVAVLVCHLAQGLVLRTTNSQKCAAVPRRARI